MSFKACLTARPTGRAGTKVGHSDPVALYGKIIAQRIADTAQEFSLLGDHNESEPPDPIPNSEVKPLSADLSESSLSYESRLCQALKHKPDCRVWSVFLCLEFVDVHK